MSRFSHSRHPTPRLALLPLTLRELSPPPFPPDHASFLTYPRPGTPRRLPSPHLPAPLAGLLSCLCPCTARSPHFPRSVELASRRNRAGHRVLPPSPPFFPSSSTELTAFFSAFPRKPQPSRADAHTRAHPNPRAPRTTFSPGEWCALAPPPLASRPVCAPLGSSRKIQTKQGE